MAGFWREEPLRPWWSWWHLLELAVVFAVGACVLNFLYTGAAVPGASELGVPGNDSYNHIKMAVLLPEIGLPRQFRWLQHIWLTQSGDDWVNHHYGFHALLVPLVYAGKALRGDWLTGGRWAMSAFFAASLTMFQLILMTQRIRCRWLWLLLFFLMPSQFFSRHAFVRAMGPSLLFMLIVIALMFRRRYLLAGLAVAAYTHLYMGGVVYGPLIVICYTVAGLLGPRGQRVSWRLAMWTLLGWVIGLLTHPYSDGMLEFLRLQIFGSGLGADIRVGTEWKPYEGVWKLAQMTGWTLVPWLAAFALRLRVGGRAGARELSVVLMSLAFGTLMLKSRRFVEYWPAFALLATALLAGPLVDDVLGRLTGWLRAPGRAAWRIVLAGVALVAASAGLLTWLRVSGEDLDIDRLTAEWRMWALLGGAYLLVPIARHWLNGARRRDALGGMLVIPLAVACFVAGVVLACGLAARSFDAHAWRFCVPWWCFVLLGVVALAVPGVAAWLGKRRSGETLPRRLAGVAGLVLGGVIAFSLALATAGPHLNRVRSAMRTKFDLPAIREMMAFLIEHSPEESIVFTDDWDVYPVYFYHNHHNSYCLGKDPKFTQWRKPVLYKRFQLITRGKTPTTYSFDDTYGGDPPIRRRLPVRLEDIRDHFRASYVIVDKDHGRFRRRLDEAETFCERLYPEPPGEDAGRERQAGSTKGDKPPYVVYRILTVEEQRAAEDAARSTRGKRPDTNRGKREKQVKHRPPPGPTRRPTRTPKAP